MLVPLTLAALAYLPSIKMGSVELVPGENLPLGGYTARGGRLSESGGDRIGARCVLLESGSTRLAVVSVDLLTVPLSLYEAVKAKIPSDLELMLVATHTHCAPDSQMLNDRMTFKIPGIASFSQRWLAWYADGLGSLVNGTVSSEQLKGELGVRLARLHLNRGRRPGAWPDSSAILMELVGPVRSQPLIYTYAAHAVFYGDDENHLRGDWPFQLAQTLSGCAVLPAAIGDVSPASEGADPAGRIANFCAATVAGLNASKPVALTAPFSLEHTPIRLPPAQPHPEFAESYKIPAVIAEELAKKFAPEDAEVTGFRIGKLAVIGIPGEPTAELGRAIRNAGWNMGFRWVAVVSHTNGWIGYILAAEDYERGGYEATLSFHGRDLGAAVTEAGIATLWKLRNRR